MIDNQITVIIFTHNEEKNISQSIQSAKILTTQIFIVDSQSTDKTIKIIKQKKIPYFSFPYSFYVEPARNFGINKAKTAWVFILDADERITNELASEIKKAIKEKKFTHYFIPRKNIFVDKWLKHGGWWPDYQPRLINKNFFITWPKQIHSSPQIKGEAGYLKNPLLHLFHGNFEKMVDKTIIFEEIEANLLFYAKKQLKILTFFRKFLGELWRRLFKNLGFLDGKAGIIEGIYQAFSKTITYLYLYEKSRSF